jgi:hypothetical protein
MGTSYLPFHDSKASAAARYRMILLATLLSWTTCTYADINIPDPDDPLPEEPRPPPTCVPAVTGTITANPAGAELSPGLPVTIDISWSASVTRTCNPMPGFVFQDLSGQRIGVDRRGSRKYVFDRPGTFTFWLSLNRNGQLSTVATRSVVVTQSLAVISPGNAVTAEDIANFDRLWMHEPLVNHVLSDFDSELSQSKLTIGWDVGERLEAMVHMFELTRNPRYLAQMHRIIEIALKHRDDRRPGAPLDAFRRDRSAPMPFWGNKTAASGDYWTASLSLAVGGAMLYPIAAFTRIVAEDPQLWGVRINPSSSVTYGQKALEYANAVLDSVEATVPDWQYRFVDGTERRWPRSLPILAEMLTESRCREASQTSGNPHDDFNLCRDYANFAGLPHPHNLNHTQLMTEIELWRTLSTPFYQQSSESSPNWAAARMWIVNNVRGSQYFFEDSLRVTHGVGRLPLPPSGPARYIWDYMVDSPRPHIEDVSHAAVSMRYIGMLRDNQELLHLGNVISNGPLRKFANTFLYNAAASERFAHDVSGRPVDADENRERDRVCAGWLELSRIDSRVYEKCAEITLRIVGGQQPNVHAVNHAALLRNKRYR